MKAFKIILLVILPYIINGYICKQETIVIDGLMDIHHGQNLLSVLNFQELSEVTCLNNSNYQLLVLSPLNQIIFQTSSHILNQISSLLYSLILSNFKGFFFRLSFSSNSLNHGLL